MNVYLPTNFRHYSKIFELLVIAVVAVVVVAVVVVVVVVQCSSSSLREFAPWQANAILSTGAWGSGSDRTRMTTHNRAQPGTAGHNRAKPGMSKNRWIPYEITGVGSALFSPLPQDTIHNSEQTTHRKSIKITSKRKSATNSSKSMTKSLQNGMKTCNKMQPKRSQKVGKKCKKTWAKRRQQTTKKVRKTTKNVTQKR